MKVKKTNILGVSISRVTMDEVLEGVEESIYKGDKLHIVTPNPEMIVLAQKDDSFKKMVNNSSLQIPDGVGLQIAADLYAQKIPNIFLVREIYLIVFGVLLGIKAFFTASKFKVLPEKVSGVDLFNRLLNQGESRGWKFYLLGGAVGVAAKAKQEILETYPGTEIVGYSAGGRINYDGETDESNTLVDDINKSGADIVVVCFGAPAQDYWISKHLDKLINVKVCMGAGATIDFWAKTQKRAPMLIRKLNLEWMWRLALEPKRLMRIFNAFPVFAVMVAYDKYVMVKYSHGSKS